MSTVEPYTLTSTHDSTRYVQIVRGGTQQRMYLFAYWASLFSKYMIVTVVQYLEIMLWEGHTSAGSSERQQNHDLADAVFQTIH